MFFVFDGVDGAGKSTQMRHFLQWLTDQSIPCTACHDPGTTELGQQIRQLLLGRHDIPIHDRSEMLLFSAARAQLVEQVIRPALNGGTVVVCDRYVLSTVVYQGLAGSLDPELIWKVNSIATAGQMPDLTFILDIDIEAASQRLGAERDRMESRGPAYLERVRQGFLAEAERWPTGIEVIDANRSVEAIQADIRAAAQPLVTRFLNSQTPRTA